MPKTRVVRDPIYGYIQLPHELATIVDHQLYQRLRRVAQTSLTSAVYPAATGTRFEHGLGAMHLAMRGWSAAWQRTDETTRDAFRGAILADLPALSDRYEKIAELVLLAVGGVALLHDVGHPPFSHVLEPLYERMSVEHFGDDYEMIDRWRSSGVAYHEFAGRVLTRVIADDLSSPLRELIVRIYESDEDDSGWAGAAHSVIAGEVDIDRLDYLMRDANKAGTEFGAIDYARLVDALELHSVSGGFKVAPGVRARSAVETLVLQRTQSYKWIIYHTGVVGANLALVRALEQLRHLTSDDQQISLDGTSYRLADLFRPIWPALNFIRPRVSDAEWRLREITGGPNGGETQDPFQLSLNDQETATLIDTIGVDLQTCVDDAVVLEALKNAHVVARLITHRASLDRSAHSSLDRLTAYTEHTLHRAKNCLPAWKTTEEFETTCRSLAPGLLKAVESAFEEVGKDSRFIDHPELNVALLDEHRRLVELLESDPTVGVNQVITLLFASEPKTLDELIRELDTFRHDIERSPGFWDAAYTGFTAIQHSQHGTVLFDGERQVPLFDSSALARALEHVEQSRYRLCVFFFAPSGIPSGADIHRLELREKLVGDFIEVFPPFVERLLPTVLLDSFAPPERSEGATP